MHDPSARVKSIISQVPLGIGNYERMKKIHAICNMQVSFAFLDFAFFKHPGIFCYFSLPKSKIKEFVTCLFS